MNQDTTEQPDLLTRDGHLTELTLNRFEAGELTPVDAGAVEQHVVGCAACKARLDSVRSFDATFAIAPPDAAGAPAAEVVSLAERRQSKGWIVAVLAAAAAVVLVVVAQTDQPRTVSSDLDDDIRLKGADLTLEVHAKTSTEKPRRVGTGDVVHPGDRLRFTVSTRVPGYLMIVGVDDAGQVYSGWPQGSGARATFTEPTAEPRVLEAAVQLDDVGSTETLVLMRCPTEFGLAEATTQLKSRTALEASPPRDPMAGCVYDEVKLAKKPRK